MNANQSAPAPFVDFKQVKAAVNIRQVLERYQLFDTFRQTGDRLSGPCPIHNGKNPTSFRVSLSKNCFNCFGSCGRGGNVIDFVALKEGVSFRDAALLLQEWFMGRPPSASHRRTPSGARVCEERRSSAVPNRIATQPGGATRDDDQVVKENPPLTFELKTLKNDHPYLFERRLDRETIEQFGLGYCSRGVHRGRIAIPIHNANGELVAYAGRWPGEPPEGQPKYKLPKGFQKNLELFNLHRALQEPEDFPLVIVEGFFDCFALWQCGIAKCVALMGSSLSGEQEELLANALPDGGVIELLLDNDEAGQTATEEIAKRLLDFALVRSITLPEGIRQPDELTPDEIAQIFE